MSDKRDKNPADFAIYSSAANVILNADSCNQLNTNIINTQLAYWKTAKWIYSSSIKNNPSPSIEDMVMVIDNLANSLLHLFGRNYQGCAAYTPSLVQYVDQSKHKSTFNLEIEKPDLFKNLESLNDDYNNVAKHTDRSKEDRILLITKSRIQLYLETTKEIWLWFGNHIYNNQISNDLLSEFTEKYCMG